MSRIADKDAVWVRDVGGEIVQVHHSPILPETDMANSGWKRVHRDGPEVATHNAKIEADFSAARERESKRRRVLDMLAANPEKLQELLK